MAVNTTIAASIKQQIMLSLQNLINIGQLNTVYEIDLSQNVLTMKPSNGYPFAIVSFPRIEQAEFQDSATDEIVYRFDVMFVLNPEEMADTTTGLEAAMDAVMSEFNSLSNLTLNNTAVASVLPITIQGAPVSTGDKTLLCFVATIKAQALYTITP